MSKPDVELVRHLSNGLSVILADGLPRPAGKEDWEYRDLPKMRQDFFDKFVKLVGADNIVWITEAVYEHNGEIYRRGQIFVSPVGIQRVRERP